jgi:hypothetical protein
MALLLEATHTHFYPGHVGAIFGNVPRSGEAGTIQTRVKFSDGVTVEAILSPTDRDGTWLLEVGPYTTAAKSRIPGKTWEVQVRMAGQPQAAFRVIRKVSPEPTETSAG